MTTAVDGGSIPPISTNRSSSRAVRVSSAHPTPRVSSAHSSLADSAVARTVQTMRDARPAVIVFTYVILALGVAALTWVWLATAAGSKAAFPLVVFGIALIAMAIFFFVALAKDPTRWPPSQPRPGRVATTHTLAFDVGEEERHSVVFTFDQMWGWLTIRVDGDLLLKRFITFSFRLRSEFEFEVGERERHDVRIEKTRRLMFAFANPQPISAFVDGRLVAQVDGVS